MALALVTLTRAKAHLRITDNYQDDDIAQKMTAASNEIVKYLKAQADATWDVVSNPPPPAVEQAILLLLGDYFWNRGDDMDKDENVWMAIERLLVTWRDPALA